MTANAQLRRLLTVLPRIADGEEHTIADIAREVGVDVKTIEADLHALTDRFGDPPGWIDAVSVFLEADRVSMNANHFKRPMRLSASEGRALELGLSMLRSERAAERREEVETTLARVRELVTREYDGGVTVEGAMGRRESLSHVPELREALRNRRRVRISYHKGSGEAAELRTICPFSFAVEQGVWYLVAHCERSAGIRIFRTDRIESIELLAENFERPADLDVDALLADGKAFAGKAPEKLRVKYSPRVARWVRERAEGESQPDGSLVVEHPLGDTDWAVRHVLQYGADAEVLGPAEVREAIVRRLEAALG